MPKCMAFLFGCSKRQEKLKVRFGFLFAGGSVRTHGNKSLFAGGSVRTYGNKSLFAGGSVRTYGYKSLFAGGSVRTHGNKSLFAGGSVCHPSQAIRRVKVFGFESDGSKIVFQLGDFSQFEKVFAHDVALAPSRQCYYCKAKRQHVLKQP
jgi:hypothetical protein